MSAVDRGRRLAAQMARAAGRVEDTDHRSEQTLEAILEILHRARHQTTDHELWQLRRVVEEINHVIQQPDTTQEEISARIASEVERIGGRLGAVQRAVEGPARDAAFEATVATVESTDDLEPGLSVLIATWNHATRLDGAIEDACAVTSPDRVIVLDDASSDSTPQLLAARPEPITVIRAVANLGLTRARNVLLAAARTQHVLFLDADNRLDHDAVAQMAELARTWQATVVHGALIEVDGSETPTGILSAAAMNGHYFARSHNVIDTLALVDLAAVRGVGGYTIEPALEPVEDWDMWHRLAATGGLLVHAPIVTGRKLRIGLGLGSQAADHTDLHRMIARTHRFDGRLDDQTVASAVIDPDHGPLWASARAVESHPELAAALGERHHDAWLPTPAPVDDLPRSVLLVGAGGVRNLGDDVTTIAAVRRLATLLDPDIAIEIVTDGERPIPVLAPGIWMGTLTEYAHRPLTHHVAVVFSGGGTVTDHFAQQTHLRRSVADQAARAGIPVIMTGQGIGPVEATAEAASGLFGTAEAVSCRDEASAALARELGARHVEVISDDAAGAAPASPADLPAPVRHLPERGWVAFNARLANYAEVDEDEIRAWADVVDEAAADAGVPVVAVAIERQPPWEIETLADLATVPRRAPWIIVDCADDPDGARSCFALALAAVVRSYHAAWFALEGGAPVLLPPAGPYYEAKNRGLRRFAGLDAAFDEREPPATADELRSRWKAVAASASAPLDGLDRRVTDWLATQLTAAGVPTR